MVRSTDAVMKVRCVGVTRHKRWTSRSQYAGKGMGGKGMGVTELMPMPGFLEVVASLRCVNRTRKPNIRAQSFHLFVTAIPLPNIPLPDYSGRAGRIGRTGAHACSTSLTSHATYLAVRKTLEKEWGAECG